MLANVIHPVLEHPPAAFGALAQRLLTREINGRGVAVFVLVVVAEVEFELVVRTELENRGERNSLPAPEALQRSDGALPDELFDLFGFHQPAGKPGRQAPIALLALEPAVVLLHRPPALGTGRFEIAEVAGHFVALELFRPADDAPGHVGNLGHELGPRESPMRHLPQLELPFAGQFGLGQLLDT